MAITKIMKMSSLGGTLNYVMKPSKTNDGELIYTFQCSKENAREDFLRVNYERKAGRNHHFKTKQWMIIQSFPIGETNYQTAFEITKKLASEYLGDKHQYVVACHTDTDHINCHIVFNATSYKDHKSFDCKGLSFIKNLRKENDLICEKYGLSTIKEPKGKGVSQKEYYARKYNRSFKYRLETMIDEQIKTSSNYDNFLENMSSLYEVKDGKYLAFKSKEQTKFIRAKTLGIDYSEQSIRFRIEHPEFDIEKPLRFPGLINTSLAKYNGKENIGLKRWATIQNIKKMASVSHNIKTENVLGDGYINENKSLFSLMKETGIRLDELDETIKYLGSISDAHAVYSSCFKLIKEYKSSTNKAEFKKKNYAKFKAYDNAKKLVTSQMSNDGKPLSAIAIKNKLEELKVERVSVYTDYQEIKQRVHSRESTTTIVQDHMNKNKDR